MAKLSLTRRSFLKAAAVTGAASTLSFAVAPVSYTHLTLPTNSRG